jgi:hypothetical protein
MQQELASISEVVWLSAPDALNRADSLLSGLGYHTTHRDHYHLTAQRPAPPSSAEQDTLMLTVSAAPQAEGGVKVAVKGDDREGMEAHQEEWAKWAASLPKKGSMKGPAIPVRPAPPQVKETARVEETAQVEAIFDRQDQLEKIRAGLLPGEEIEAVLDVKGGGTGFVGITSKRVIFQDNAWVVKSMAVVSIPYSRIHTVAAEDSASLLTGRGFFSSSRIIITTSGGSRVFQFRGADKAHIAHNLILRHIL